MKFSVVIPIFNAESTLDACLKSVSKQILQPFEVILIDDGSKDKTSEIIENWKRLLPIKSIHNKENIGITKSLIKGLEISSEAWIARLDADDTWLPEHLAIVSNAINLNPKAVLISSPAFLYSDNGSLLGKSSAYKGKDIQPLLMWDNPFIASGTCFAKKSYLEAGGYQVNDEWEDYNLSFRLAQIGQCIILPTYSVNYTLTKNSLSRSIQKNRSSKKRHRTQMKAIKAFYPIRPIAALHCLVFGFLRRYL